MNTRDEIEPAAATKYCRRFGELAMRMGYLDGIQLSAALQRQREDVAVGRPHRLIGGILFQEGAMSPEQIETVLREVLRGTDDRGQTPVMK